MISSTVADMVLACWLGETSDVEASIAEPPQQFSDWQPATPSDASRHVSSGPGAQARLDAVEAARRHADAAQAVYLGLLAEADRRDETMLAQGVPTASWLAAGTAHSARAAREQVRLAQQLASLPVVAAALAAGEVSCEQAAVICGGVSRVTDLDRPHRDALAAHLVELASDFGPVELRRLVNHAVEVVAPHVAEAADREALERAERAQQRDRYLTWRHDPDTGSVVFRGQLPALEGQLFTEHLRAIGERQRESDALAGVDTSRGQAHADALALTVAHHAQCLGGPVRGGDATRVVVTIDHASLVTATGAGMLLGCDPVTEGRVSVGRVRQLACSAGILPVVLDGAGVPLDVGREQRLFTPHQRVALAVRDGGCAFPGCDRPPSDCEAHHITPWWAGGRSDLANGVLLCPHHHHLVEPDPHAPPERNWVIDFDARGRPRFTGPATGAGTRVTRQHRRYRT